MERRGFFAVIIGALLAGKVKLPEKKKELTAHQMKMLTHAWRYRYPVNPLIPRSNFKSQWTKNDMPMLIRYSKADVEITYNMMKEYERTGRL